MLAQNTILRPALTIMSGIASQLQRSGMSYANFRQFVEAMHHAGVPILAGLTRMRLPGRRFTLCMGRFCTRSQNSVDAGMSEVEALRSATVVPAERRGMRDRGVIALGTRADLVLLAEDPVDIGATKVLRGVWCGGVRW